GGKGGKEHRPGGARFGIGVRQPGGHRRRGGVDEHPDENQPAVEIGQGYGLYFDGAGVDHHPLDADLEEHAPQQVHGGVADAGAARPLGAAAPHHHGGEDRHQLPEQEHGDQIPGEGHANGPGGVGLGGGQLPPFGLAEGEQPAGEGHDGEDGGEQAAQGARLDELDLGAEELGGEEDAVLHLPD